MKHKLPEIIKLQRGFTLIELLIVITILTVLSVAVFTALNPAQRLRDAKDARRATDVQEILTSIHQAIIDNGGSIPTNLPISGTERMIGIGGTSPECGTAVAVKGCNVPASQACANLLSGTINISNYLASLPVDPTGGSTYNSSITGYAVNNTNGIITIKACGAEGTNNISASR